MRLDYAKVARKLWETGFAYFPVNQALVDEARAAQTAFIHRHISEGTAAQWQFTRPGEEGDPDLGLIERTKAYGRDVKWFLHFTRELKRSAHTAGLLLSPEDEAFFQVMDRLYGQQREWAEQLGTALAERLGSQFARSLLRTFDQPMPYCTSTLRGLYYPNPVGSQQKGADGHVDRSALTFHLGDIGGELRAHRNWDDVTGVPISPEAGFALVMFGVKIIELTEGEVLPLLHSSTCEVGLDRHAFVGFCHVRTKYLVRDSRDALKHFQRMYPRQGIEALMPHEDRVSA